MTKHTKVAANTLEGLENPVNTIIRIAKKLDAEEIAAVALQTYRETYRRSTLKKAESLYGKNFIEKIYPTWLKDKNNVIALIKINEKTIGFAKLTVHSHTGLLDKLYILKSHQRKGYGRQLLQFCYEQAAILGATKGKLLVYEKNKKAINFYQKCGFITTGERENYLLPDGTLSKTLNDVMRCADIRVLQSNSNATSTIKKDTVQSEVETINPSHLFARKLRSHSLTNHDQASKRLKASL